MQYLVSENDYMRALQDLNNDLERLLKDYSESLSRAKHLENFKLSKLADIRNQHDDGKTPQSKLDALARSDHRFEEFLDELNVESKKAIYLQAKRDQLKTKISSFITCLSVEKEKMKLQ